MEGTKSLHGDTASNDANYYSCFHKYCVFLRGLVLGKLIGVKNVNSSISYQYRIVFKSSSSFLSLTIFYHS